MAQNLPVAFASLLAGGVLLDAGIKGASISDVVQGKAKAVSATSSTATSSGGSGSAGQSTADSLAGQGTGTLAPAESGALNSNQAAFAGELQKQTGLSSAVITGWLLSEEPASSAGAPNGANNWLNIGAFDSGNWAGGGSSVWSSPISGADATAAFILGRPVNGISAPFTAASSIRAIAGAAGSSISAQVSAIQNSGWASSGYPNLGSVVDRFL